MESQAACTVTSFSVVVAGGEGQPGTARPCSERQWQSSGAGCQSQLRCRVFQRCVWPSSFPSMLSSYERTLLCPAPTPRHAVTHSLLRFLPHASSLLYLQSSVDAFMSQLLCTVCAARVRPCATVAKQTGDTSHS